MASNIVIETVKVARVDGRRNKSELDKVFADMDVGNSFMVPEGRYATLASATSSLTTKAKKLGYKVSVGYDPDGNIRCWMDGKIVNEPATEAAA